MSKESEKEIVFGVYFHPKKGFAIAEPSSDQRNDWQIDKNQKRPHPLFRFEIDVVESGTGKYFFNRSLRGYEYIGEL
jgi:hypothetical protein